MPDHRTSQAVALLLRSTHQMWHQNQYQVPSGRSLYAVAISCDRLAGKDLLYERHGIHERCVDGATVIFAWIIMGLNFRTSITSGHDKIGLGFWEDGYVGQTRANEDWV